MRRDVAEHFAAGRTATTTHLAGCHGKQAFDTRPDAERVLKLAHRRNGRVPLNTYRCISCHHWHIGANSSQQ